jgi:hypothetical protein
VIAASREAFAEAVGAYRFGEHTFDAEALSQARASIEAADMLVVGEPHGMAETPAVLYALARELGTRAVAFEWSHEELDDSLQSIVAGAAPDFEALWSLPATAEFFCGDGRITAGHFALLQRLRAEGRLEQAIAFDRLDPDVPVEWEVRDREMAERLLGEWSGAPLLVLTGGFHAQLTGEAMAAHLARERAGLSAVMLDYGVGPMPAAPSRLGIVSTAQAVVPAPAPA